MEDSARDDRDPAFQLVDLLTLPAPGSSAVFMLRATWELLTFMAGKLWHHNAHALLAQVTPMAYTGGRDSRRLSPWASSLRSPK